MSWYPVLLNTIVVLFIFVPDGMPFSGKEFLFVFLLKGYVAFIFVDV